MTSNLDPSSHHHQQQTSHADLFPTFDYSDNSTSQLQSSRNSIIYPSDLNNNQPQQQQQQQQLIGMKRKASLTNNSSVPLLTSYNTNANKQSTTTSNSSVPYNTYRSKISKSLSCSISPSLSSSSSSSASSSSFVSSPLSPLSPEATSNFFMLNTTTNNHTPNMISSGVKRDSVQHIGNVPPLKLAPNCSCSYVQVDYTSFNSS